MASKFNPKKKKKTTNLGSLKWNIIYSFFFPPLSLTWIFLFICFFLTSIITTKPSKRSNGLWLVWDLIPSTKSFLSFKLFTHTKFTTHIQTTTDIHTNTRISLTGLALHKGGAGEWTFKPPPPHLILWVVIVHIYSRALWNCFLLIPQPVREHAPLMSFLLNIPVYVKLELML